MIGVGLSIVQLAVRQMLGGAFTPASLFANNEPGVWYDPSDLTTLFQDSAGTTPVTAVEQPVGLMLDKSGRGNHATQTTSTSRPVLSARYNLLTKTEQFNEGVWAKTAATVSANAAVAPDGTSTADKLIPNSGSVSPYINISAAQAVTSGTSYTATWHVSAGQYRYISLFELSSGTGAGLVLFDLQSETVSGAANGASVSQGGITSLGSGWYRLTYTYTATAATSQPRLYISGSGTAISNVTGNGSNGVFIWGASLVPANQASLPYQRVNTATDYDTAGFPSGENFDGSDDYQTAPSGGGSTTAFFWCSAIMVRKVGSTQTLFSDTGTNTGYRVRINASNQLELSAGNSSAYTTVATTATLSYGQIAVLTAWHDGTNLKVQIDNGTVHQAAFTTASAGTASLTIGRDNGAASSYAGIRLFEKVYLKNLVPSAGDIAKTKTYVGATAGMTI